MFSRFALAGFVVLLIAIVSEVEAQAELATAPPMSVSQQPIDLSSGLVLGQYSDSSSGSTRVSGRGVRGIVKLAVLGGILLISGVGWVIRKVSGG